jgi:peptide/nickel transport system substrate-binding protein
LVLLLAVGCAGPSSPAERTTGAPPAGGAAATEPKVLTWAIQQEPTDVTALSGLGGTRGPTSAFRQVAHAQLVKDDHTNAAFSELALELPSTDKGTWVVQPDGTMETTWKLRPNVKWHDGTPFTSDDLVFWLTVLKDKNIPSTSLIGLDQITSVTAPDPLTFVIHWSTPHYRADRIPEYGPIPRHILEPVYAQGNAEALLTHRYFSTEFVGLGPYKLAAWDPGSRIEFARFDDYFIGRPPLDRLILQIVPDFNTMVSNVLAGTVDIASPPADNMDVAMDLKRRWEGTGNRVRTDPNTRIRLIYPQYRAEHARPANGVTNPTVRQALYQGLDRPALANVITEGLAPIADSWFGASHPLRKDVESAIPQYPYDPGRAQQLLAEAGWVRGADGTVANQATGERFDIEVRNRPGSATERELIVVADYWKAIGIAASPSPSPPSLVTDREWLATYPGVQISRLENEDAFNTRRLHSRAIAAPSNRWAGRNGAGFSNPDADAIQERLIVTINRPEQIALHRQLLQEVMGEVAILPLFWDVELALATQSVKGDVTAAETGWNAFTWGRQ